MTRRQKYLWLASLYIAQGLPYGFFLQALPIILRLQQVSLPAIGASFLLTLPWSLKFLISPWADRLHFKTLGLRKSWILPIQFCAAFLFLLASLFNPAENLPALLLAFLGANLTAAVQDVATDGLAVDLLKTEERGVGNGIQVAGYRLGMVIGGLILPLIYSQLSWAGTMYAMSGFILLLTLPTIFLKEPKVRTRPPAIRSIMQVFKETFHFALKPGAAAWIIVLFIYKFGHSGSTAMLRPWFVDQGYTTEAIVKILGTAGFTMGLLGAICGGWLARRPERRKFLVPLGLTQCLAVALYLLPIHWGGETLVIFAVALDHFTSGVATTVLFAVMMDVCDPKRAATDYSFQACLIVISTGLANGMSGVLADQFGYSGHFAFMSIFAILAIVTVALLLRRRSALFEG